MKRFTPAVRPDIAAMAPYTPIVPFEVLSAQLGRPPEEIVKLDANENPYGPPPAARAALANGRYYHIYPDPLATALRDALAGYTGVPAKMLLAGAGADELIDLVLRAVLAPGDGVVNCPPSFGMYPFSTAVNAGALINVPRHDDFSLNLPAIKDAVARHPRARILFLCSPNNPDGSLVDDAALQQLLKLPLVIILDEAYVDFSGRPSRLNWVADHANLVVLRTFSKLAGLAGLRVGYGAFPDWLLPHLVKIKQPYNVNVAADIAARAALGERGWLAEKVAAIIAERERLSIAVDALPYLETYPSHANFILCRVHGRSAAQLKTDLAARGILVRYFDKPGLTNCIRITAGRPADTDRLLAALETLA